MNSTTSCICKKHTMRNYLVKKKMFFLTKQCISCRKMHSMMYQLNKYKNSDIEPDNEQENEHDIFEEYDEQQKALIKSKSYTNSNENSNANLGFQHSSSKSLSQNDGSALKVVLNSQTN